MGKKSKAAAAATTLARDPQSSPAAPANAQVATASPASATQAVQVQRATGKLLSGIKFYASRAIPPERRTELSALIRNNGGVVLTQIERDAIELVDNGTLRQGKPWVSSDFVYDSVRDQTLRDLAEYTAPGWQATATVTANERSVQITEQPKRRGRVEYTAADDAKMFQFVENYTGKTKSMESVPLSVWKMAERVNVTTHSSESMHEHYRKLLRKYTPQERRNTLLHAQAEEDARQRREIAALNGRRVSPQATVKSTTGATAASLAGDGAASGASAAETETASATEAAVSAAASSAEPQEPKPDASEAMASSPVATNDKPGDKEHEEEHDEEVQGRGKKRGRKSTAAEQQNAATPDSGSKRSPPRKDAASTDGGKNPQRNAPAPSAAAQSVLASDSAADTANTSSSSDNNASPVLSVRKQQKQKLKPSAASPREAATSSTPVATEKKTSVPATPPSPPPPDLSSESGIFFSSRWEELIHDTGNRQHLQQFFSLSRPRDAPASVPKAADVKRGKTFRQVVRALPPSRAKVRTTTAHNSDSADDEPATTRRRQRAEAPAPAEKEESKEAEVEAKESAPAPPKKRKVLQSSQQQRQQADPSAPVVHAARSSQLTAHRRGLAQQQQQKEAAEQVLVTSEADVDHITCQLQFQTDQELNAVVHALYYASGDVELALGFLRGASCSGDLWSLEDDLLLGDLVSDATDARRVAEAQRHGAFSRMRVKRTLTQILTRIRYLL